MNSGQFYPSFHQGLDQGMLDQQPPSLSPFHMPMQQLPPPPHHHHSHMSPYAMTAMPAPIPRAKGQRRGVRRNPEAPKRPMSPYVTFVKDKWKSVHLSLPGAAAKDVMRTLGEQWNALPAAEKEKWKALSDEDKARYANEMQSFDGPSTVAVARRGNGIDGGRRRRARKDPNAPKRGASAFLLFANEKRKALKDANPTMHNTDISRMLGAIWKAADDATKAPYIQAEAEARRQYGKAMEEYRSQVGQQHANELEDHHNAGVHHDEHFAKFEPHLAHEQHHHLAHDQHHLTHEQHMHMQEQLHEQHMHEQQLAHEQHMHEQHLHEQHMHEQQLAHEHHMAAAAAGGMYHHHHPMANPPLPGLVPQSMMPRP